MHEGGHGQGGRRRARRRGMSEGDRADQPEGDHRRVEQVHRQAPPQRHRLDGRPHQRHLQVWICFFCNFFGFL